MPEPPATPTEGPSTPQPSDDTFWVPGNWTNVNDQYAWRPGYWAESNPNWIWEPARYLWTPNGYLFVGGFWDRPLVNRGLLFAPIAFARPVYTQPQFAFTPQVVIDTGLLTTNLFVRPSYSHYYFGDFYGQSYVARGFQPWFSVHVRRNHLRSAVRPLSHVLRTARSRVVQSTTRKVRLLEQSSGGTAAAELF